MKKGNKFYACSPGSEVTRGNDGGFCCEERHPNRVKSAATYALTASGVRSQG